VGQLDSWASWIIEGVGKHNGVTQDLSADGRPPPSIDDFKRSRGNARPIAEKKSSSTPIRARLSA